MRPTARRSVRWLCLGLIVSASGCAPRLQGPIDDPTRALTPTWIWSRPALLDDGDVESLREAVGESLAWLDGQPADRAFVFGPRTVSTAELRRGLGRLLDRLAGNPQPAALAAWVRAEFEVLESVGAADGTVLVTGYYEPVIEAAERPSAEYAVPIFARPDDLVDASLEAFSARFRGERIAGRLEGRRLVPYWSRGEIADGRLAGRGLELAWGKDPVDVFFLAIQGSGTLRLPDGREIRIGYAASNGRPYRSIGRLLVDERKMELAAVSLPALRAWLAAHPEDRERVLRYNESFVFFRRLDGPPVGSLGVPVTPGRSVATDPRLFPSGALAFLRTERPMPTRAGAVEWKPLSRFVLNQDSGGAIRGPGRVDLFWGRGSDAGLAAGLMKQPGRLYFLVPRALTAPARPPGS